MIANEHDFALGTPAAQIGEARSSEAGAARALSRKPEFFADPSAELTSARAETDALLSLLDEQTLYERPLPQRHRLIFYVGHLEAFDWNQAKARSIVEPRLESAFDQLFGRGIDPEPGQLPSDPISAWPRIDQVRAYVSQVREKVDRIFAGAPREFQQTAVEHRWMHAETLAYQLHMLPYDWKRQPSRTNLAPAPLASSSSFRSGMITVPAGQATLGLSREHGFGWDNEFDEVSVPVPSFDIAQHKITNGEYLEFVQSGQDAPHFWSNVDGEWFYRGMFESSPLPLNSPVYVTHTEAAAFAQWRGLSLPSEAQFHRAAFGTPGGEERQFPWGNQAGNPAECGNYDSQEWDPVPVTSYPGGRSAFGADQMVGNGWEWTRTLFAPFPGFQPKPHYPGYSADFFDNRHYVLKGASPRTAKLLTRRSLRNWFRPDYPYVYATFRLVND